MLDAENVAKAICTCWQDTNCLTGAREHAVVPKCPSTFFNSSNLYMTLYASLTHDFRALEFAVQK